MQPLSGQWVLAAAAPVQVPLAEPLDPRHATPDPNPEYGPGNPAHWRQATPVPGLPDAVEPGSIPEVLPTGVGPIDHTPQDHNFGPGYSPALDTLAAQDADSPWHRVNDGSVAARAYVHPVMRDGSTHVDVIQDPSVQMDSPGTTLLQRTGYGVPTDPEAWLGRRIQRWFRRSIDMHRYDVVLRPHTLRYAAPQYAATAAGQGSYVPPYGNVVSHNPQSPDRMVRSMVRRAPQPWDESQSVDGAAANVTGSVDDFGLGQYGL